MKRSIWTTRYYQYTLLLKLFTAGHVYNSFQPLLNLNSTVTQNREQALVIKKKKNHIFIKPLRESSYDIMIVITDSK